MLPIDEPGDHNQAMMELGATVCLRHNPGCAVCPVREFCAGARSGDPQQFPRLASKKIERHVVARVWCERRGALLLHRSHASARRFANIHELPTAAHLDLDSAKVVCGELLATRRRAITRFQITETIHSVAVPRGKLLRELVWVSLRNLDAVTLSGPHRRWITEILVKRVGRHAGL